MVTTMFARHTQTNTNILGAHVNPYTPATQQMIGAARQLFMSKGMDAVTATQQAYATVFGTVQREAAMLSFIGAFRMLGILFLAVMPLILIMKKPRHHEGGGMAAH